MVEVNDEAVIDGSVDDSDFPLMPVSRPWYVYLMSLYAFVAVRGFASSLSINLLASNPDLLNITRGTIALLAIVLIVNMINMKKKYLIVFGVCCILLAIYQMYNIYTRIFMGPLNNVIVVLLLYYVIPSCAMAALTLRPKFLSVADRYCKFKRQAAIRKIAIKMPV